MAPHFPGALGGRTAPRRGDCGEAAWRASLPRFSAAGRGAERGGAAEVADVVSRNIS